MSKGTEADIFPVAFDLCAGNKERARYHIQTPALQADTIHGISPSAGHILAVDVDGLWPCMEYERHKHLCNRQELAVISLISLQLVASKESLHFNAPKHQADLSPSRHASKGSQLCRIEFFL